MRVTGARHLAELGLGLILIQILGRWGGDTFLRYIAEAPLSKLAGCYRELQLGKDLGSVRTQALDDMATQKHATHTPGHIECGQDAIDELAEEVQMLRTMVADDVSRLMRTVHESGMAPGTFIAKGAKRRMHVVRVGLPDGSRAWKCRCGWKFGAADFGTYVDCDATGKKCTRCFKPSAQESTDTTSSDARCSSTGAGASGHEGWAPPIRRCLWH